MGFLEVHDDQVGQCALANHAQFAFGVAQSAGAVDRRQLQRFVSRERDGVARGGFLQEGRRAHLLEHVEIVVGAGAVGADGHQRTRGAQPLDGRHAARNLHVALRVVRHGHAARGQRRNVGVGQIDAVCADGAGVEHAQRVEVFDGRHAVFLAHDAHLVLRLGDMGHQVQSVPLGRLFAAPQVFGRHGVGRMGCEGDPDPVAAGGEFHRLPHFGKHLFDVAVKIVAAQHRTDAQPLGHFDAAVLVVIHIHERGHAAQQLLDNAESHSQRHVVGRLPRFERPDIVVKPLHQGDIVGITALQRHGGVAVGIDKPRHHKPARAVDDPRVGMRGTECVGFGSGRRDQRDAAARDAHETRKGFGTAFVRRHRQNRGVGKKNCHK